jgi:hypothetical protein
VELIIFVGALCIVGVLAMRFGQDSRTPAYSKEEDQANLGLHWGRPGETSDPKCVPNYAEPQTRGDMDPYTYR